MNDDVAFIDAILANESDDTARLVYADWLADHGEPELGAFVRLQAEVYHIPSADPRRLEVRNREKDAWKAYQKKWKAALALGRIGRGHFTRGVISPWKAVDFPSPPFVEQSGGWGPGVPVHRVTIDGVSQPPAVDERLAGCPFLARVAELQIGKPSWVRYETGLIPGPAAAPAVPAAAVVALARSPHIGRLRRLEIAMVRPSRALFAELAACPQLDQIQFALTLVPYSGWGTSWFNLPLRWFQKAAGVPIAETAGDMLDGPMAEHLID